ncbi:unnamed protein product [Caretta caretta]
MERSTGSKEKTMPPFGKNIPWESDDHSSLSFLHLALQVENKQEKSSCVLQKSRDAGAMAKIPGSAMVLILLFSE